MLEDVGRRGGPQGMHTDFNAELLGVAWDELATDRAADELAALEVLALGEDVRARDEPYLQTDECHGLPEIVTVGV